MMKTRILVTLLVVLAAASPGWAEPKVVQAPADRRFTSPDETPGEISAEVTRLSRESATVSVQEVICLEAALAAGTYSTSSSSDSYSSSSASQFGSSSSARRFGGRRSGFVDADRSYSSTYGSAGRGSGDSSSSSSYSTPEMRATACREKARASREAIVVLMNYSVTNPQAFVALARERRLREQAANAQWVALLEQSLPDMRRDLEALVSASPSQTGLEPFSWSLESLQQRLTFLWTSSPGEGDHRRIFKAVQEAIRGLAAARDEWTPGDRSAAEAAQLEEAVQALRQRLTRSPSSVGQAEMEAQEHNLRGAKSRVARSEKRSEAAWRRALPLANAALSGLAK